jgi:hypothetical protein
MIRAMRNAVAGLAAAVAASSAQDVDDGRSRADPEANGPRSEVVFASGEGPDIQVADESTPHALPQDVASDPLPCRCGLQNPPSRVIHGRLVRRVVPSRYAKPFDCGPYRYEPKLGDIRDVPPSRTLPGYYEGSKEILYSLPARDRGYFVLFRW